MKTLNRSIFNFVLAFMLMTATGVSAFGSAIVAGALSLGLNFIPASYSSAFSGFITAGSQYNGKENEDMIIRPFFIGQLPTEMGIRVISSVKTTIKLTFLNSKSKILKAYADGFQGGTGATFKQKKLELKEFKAEAEYSKQNYKTLIQEDRKSVV